MVKDDNFPQRRLSLGRNNYGNETLLARVQTGLSTRLMLAHCGLFEFKETIDVMVK